MLSKLLGYARAARVDEVSDKLVGIAVGLLRTVAIWHVWNSFIAREAHLGAMTLFQAFCVLGIIVLLRGSALQAPADESKRTVVLPTPELHIHHGQNAPAPEPVATGAPCPYCAQPMPQDDEEDEG